MSNHDVSTEFLQTGILNHVGAGVFQVSVLFRLLKGKVFNFVLRLLFTHVTVVFTKWAKNRGENRNRNSQKKI